MSTETTTARRTIWKHGVAAALVAGAVTSGLAAVAKQAGVSFLDPASGLTIPVLGFFNLTVGFSLIGLALAAILARKAKQPRSTFIKTTVALTALSVVPDFVAIPHLSPDFDTATAFTLAGFHVVAAAIVIPTMASRLATQR